MIEIDKALLEKIIGQVQQQIIPAASLIAGWFLARLTDHIREKRKTRKLCKLIESELTQLEEELKLLLIKLQRNLQIAAKKCISSSTHLPIEAHIYDNYYKDAVIGFTKPQRVSLQLIHTSIRYINNSAEKSEEIILKTKNSDSKESFLASQRQWKELLTGSYINVKNAIWHINHHKSRPKDPVLSIGTDTHKSYLQYNEKTREEIKIIMSSAEKIPIEKFENFYNEEDFSKKFKK